VDTLVNIEFELVSQICAEVDQGLVERRIGLRTTGIIDESGAVEEGGGEVGQGGGGTWPSRTRQVADIPATSFHQDIRYLQENISLGGLTSHHSFMSLSSFQLSSEVLDNSCYLSRVFYSRL